jgi:DHA3 family macrolide efflux protein-like MFS transporter
MLGGLRNKVHTMVLANLANAACIVLLGVVPVFWLYLLVTAVIGVVIPAFNTASTVLLQQRVSGEYLGRVFGIFGMIASISMPVGMLVFGPMADYVKVEWLLIGSGIALFAQGSLMLASKTLVQAGEPVALEEHPSGAL